MSALSTYFKLNHYKQHHRRTAGSLIRRLVQWQINWRTRRQLARLPDHMLTCSGILAFPEAMLNKRRANHSGKVRPRAEFPGRISCPVPKDTW